MSLLAEATQDLRSAVEQVHDWIAKRLREAAAAASAALAAGTAGGSQGGALQADPEEGFDADLQDLEVSGAHVHK